MRVISLLSSATEILHALGLGAFQVGRSHECDYPPEVVQLPVCSRPNIPVHASSLEIDTLVRQRAASAVSIYDLDSELIARLRPTHILTQTQCKVCAVSLEDVELALARTTGVHAKVVSLEPHCLCDVWSDVRRVAFACGAMEAGEQLIAKLTDRLRAIADRVPDNAPCPRVVTVEWIEPLMTGGNWIPELIEIAGAVDLLGMRGSHSPYVDLQAVAGEDPDLIVLFPCGFDIGRTLAELHPLLENSDWMQLRAVRSGKVYVCDGNQFMNRPGPRLVESAQIFAEILHAEIFGESWKGTGWISLHAARATA